jgi:hypothetical protein
MQVQITDLERALILNWVKRDAAEVDNSTPKGKELMLILQGLYYKLYGHGNLFPLDTNLQP